MQFLPLALGLAHLFPTLVLGVPAPQSPTRVLQKREQASPVIGPGFTAQETKQLMDGIFDAMELAAYVRAVPKKTDEIFKNYFDEGDRKMVDNVFDTIFGGDVKQPPGNPLLADITIVPDFTDARYQLACTKPGAMAALRYPDTDNPKMVICAGGGFGHGGIAKGYDNVNAIDCAFTKLNGGRVSWRMETLGSIILHEYTHFAKLMGAKPARSRGKVDIAYGPFATRGMDPVHALRNSDSYSWLANEVFWSVQCPGGYTAPVEQDEEDENCDNSACTA